MAPKLNSKVVSVAIFTTAVGATLITLLATLLRRRRRQKASRPDVLNEAHPIDVALHDGYLPDSDRRQVEEADINSSLRSLRSLSRASSTNTLTLTSVRGCSLEQLCHLGNQYVQKASLLWEEALSKSLIDSPSKASMPSHIRSIVNRLRDIENLYQSEFVADVALDAAVSALQELDTDYERRHGHSITSDDHSTDTFVSASELPDLSDLEEKISEKSLERKDHLYEVGLLELKQNSVPYRKLRTEKVGCCSDSEFLAKLHVIRIALQEIMKVDMNRNWFMNTGKAIITSIMAKAQRDPNDFLLAMEKMEQFLAVQSNFDVLQTELGVRGVKCFTLYDVVLDWMLMDAFDDLSNPPGSVLSVVQNRWLSNGLKETAISTAIWSILQAKRRLLKIPDGFIARFYAISETISPVLAWAFLGPESELKDVCLTFKNESENFIKDLFDTGRVSYSSLDEMKPDILKVAEERAQTILTELQSSSTLQMNL